MGRFWGFLWSWASCVYERWKRGNGERRGKAVMPAETEQQLEPLRIFFAHHKITLSGEGGKNLSQPINLVGGG